MRRHSPWMLSFILLVLLGLSGLATAAPRPPLFFEANQGQSDPQVRFLARSGGYTLLLTPTEAVLALKGPAAVRMKLAGEANPAPEVVGEDPLASKVNYLRGADPSRWRKDVPTYGRVRYQAVYPGIDLVFYGKDRALEYDFIVGPGIDPGAIRLLFEGSRSVALGATGELILETAAGPLTMSRPVLYQEVDGDRREVAGGYRLDGQQVGFVVGEYDRTRPLVIDPQPGYDRSLGGSGTDNVTAVVGLPGAAYVAGLTASPDLPPGYQGPGLDPGYNGGTDVFIARLDGIGQVERLTYLGGSGFDYATGMVRDGDGNLYLTGHTSSADFPTTPGAFDESFDGGAMHFVVKLADLSTLVYSTFLSAGPLESVIAVDASGNAYVAGTAGAGFPTTPGAFQPDFQGGPSTSGFPLGRDGFVAKLNSAGSALVYSTYLGDAQNNEQVRGIAVSASGEVVVAGEGAGVEAQAFVTRLTADGSGLVYSLLLGRRFIGNGGNFVNGVALDGAGAAYVVGSADASAGLAGTAGAYQTSVRGENDAFVLKLDAAGALVDSTFLGGSGWDGGVAIAVDEAGRTLIAGNTHSPDFPTTPPCQNGICSSDDTLGGSNDAFFAILGHGGASLAYGTYRGGSSSERTVALSPAGPDFVYIVGTTLSPDFWFPGLASGIDGFVSYFRVPRQTDTGCAGSGFTIGPTTATPDPVAPDRTEGIVAEVCSGSDRSNILVDLEIYDAGGQKIAQRIFGNELFAVGQPQTYGWDYAVPAALPHGEYTVKIGIFSGDWSTLHAWENHAASFTVGPPPPGSCPGRGVTVGPTSATPSPVSRGATETIQTRVCSGTALSNALVDVGVFLPNGGRRIAQWVLRDQNLAADEPRDYQVDLVVPASLAAGPYVVTVGVFSGGWSILHAWDDQAATFQVSDGGAPPPASCTGGFTIGPTTATPSPVARGGMETIQARVCSGAAASNILVDLEIYNAGGQKIAQRIFANQNFAAGVTLSYTWSYMVEGTSPPAPTRSRSACSRGTGACSIGGRTRRRPSWSSEGKQRLTGGGGTPRLTATMEPRCAGWTAYYGYYFSRRLPAGPMP